MSPGTGRVVPGGLARCAAVALTLALCGALPAAASYVEDSPTPSPSPTASPSATASPSPSPSPTQQPSEPLPPADDDYWDDIDDPESEPPSPEPTATSGGSEPREQRHDRVGPREQEGGRVEIDADSRSPEGQDGTSGTESGGGGAGGGNPYGDARYPSSGFDSGYGLVLPSPEDAPVYADPEAPAVPARGSRSTEPIVRRLREAGAPVDQVARTMAPFPVAGLATYTADWSAPAEAKGFEPGNFAAIMSEEGTPVVASANGPVHRVAPDPAWGTALELTGPDGTRYRYGRLLRVAPAVQDGMKVVRGQIIGFVGATGTVGGGSYLWFQLVGKDDTIVSPFEHLDRWLKEALAAARVTTGLAASDTLDEVAAGLVSPEEAGVTIGPDGRPVASTEDRLTALDILLFLAIALPLGWRGVRAGRRWWRGRQPRAVPALASAAVDGDTSTPDAAGRTAEPAQSRR